MSKKSRLNLIIVVILLAVAALVWYLSKVNIPVLQPAGQIGLKERGLMIIASLLAVVIVAPVFTILFVFAWRYREGNKHSKYSPTLDSGRVVEALWWLIPSAIILVLSLVTWYGTYALSPYKPLASTKKPLQIQVVATDWKWLFIYPRQNVATVGYFDAPLNTPIHFQVTSDSVMNSFWVPQLGGQIYAMPGMSTQLYLIGNKLGSYNGWSANISGRGFASMTFSANIISGTDFNNWLQQVKTSPQHLTMSGYTAFAKPSIVGAQTYSNVTPNLYASIISKYMGSMSMSGSSTNNQQTSNNMTNMRRP